MGASAADCWAAVEWMFADAKASLLHIRPPAMTRRTICKHTVHQYDTLRTAIANLPSRSLMFGARRHACRQQEAPADAEC